MIPESEWVWQGHAGHFIASDHCKFRMATRVGKYLISTVGDYYYDAATAKILNTDPKEPRDIGWDRKFETFVFPVSPEPMDCGCAEVTDWSEIDSNGYRDAASATRGHMEMCRKWAQKENSNG